MLRNTISFKPNANFFSPGHWNGRCCMEKKMTRVVERDGRCIRGNVHDLPERGMWCAASEHGQGPVGAREHQNG